MVDFIIWIKDLYSVLKKHTISLIFILLIYILFWHVPQVKDLLATINQDEKKAVPLFFTALTVLAFLISNLYFMINNTEDKNKPIKNKTRKLKSIHLVSQDEKEKFILLEATNKINISKKNNTNTSKKFNEIESSKEYIIRMLPKVLGTFLIVVTAFAVNHTYYDLTGLFVFSIFLKFPISIGFYFVTILLLISLNKNISEKIKPFFDKFDKKYHFSFFLAVIFIFAIITFGFFNKKGDDGDIINFFYALLFLAGFFFLISVSYDKWILNIKKYFGFYAIVFLIIVVCASYIVYFIKPNYTSSINPLTIIIINFISFFSFISCLKLLGKKRGKPYFKTIVFILFFLGFITANNTGFNHFEVSSVKTVENIDERLELDTYIKLWLNQRKSVISNYSKSNKFPVIFVSAEGGGSRAGLWTFLVHSYLYEKNPDYFNKHLFSLSGASGGGVGNTMFYSTINRAIKENKSISLSYTKQEIKKTIVTYKASQIYTGNFISSSIAALLGQDFLKSISVIDELYKVDDRGKLVENEWEKNYNSVFKSNTIGKEFLTIKPQVNDSTILPLLMINTTHLQSGQRSIISPIKFSNNQYMSGFRDFLKNYKYGDTTSRDKSIKISTAMLLNARFPYLSPVAKVKGVGQFGDAGYYDNIGGAVTRGLENAFKEILYNDTIYTGIKDKIEIRHLLIAHNEKKKKKVTLNNTQLLAPLKMILGATFSHPNEMKKAYPQFLIESKRTKITKDSIEPILPLGRYLSLNAILSLEKRLTKGSIKNKLDSLLIHK